MPDSGPSNFRLPILNNDAPILESGPLKTAVEGQGSDTGLYGARSRKAKHRYWHRNIIPEIGTGASGVLKSDEQHREQQNLFNDHDLGIHRANLWRSNDTDIKVRGARR